MQLKKITVANLSIVCTFKIIWLLVICFMLSISETESRMSVPCTCKPITNPRSLYTVPQLIRDMGYNAEVHTVTTSDGYILEMHRIPPTQNKISLKQHRTEKEPNLCHGKGKHVAFLMHGLLCSSAEFIMNNPDQALGFMMADAGWDVWIGNNRGNTYSRKHTHLDPDTDSKFWDYSWDTIGRYDLPAMLGYVRNHTGVGKLDYVGHSMGTKTFYAMMHFHPSLKSWINVMVSLGPDAYINHMLEVAKAPLRLANTFEELITQTSGGEMLESSLTFNSCPHTNSTKQICDSNILNLLNLFRAEHADPDYKAIINAHNPAGTSIRSISHYGQNLNSRGFKAYDHGRERNLIEYGTVDAPDIDLKRVQVPVALYWGEADVVSSPEDIRRLASELPNLIVNHEVKYTDFGHMDFIWADNASYVYYHLMRTFLSNSCPNKL